MKPPVELASTMTRCDEPGLVLSAIAEVEPAAVEVGLPVRFAIRLTGADAGRASIVPPEAPGSLGPFEFRPVPTRPGEAVAYELRSFDAGELEIPAIGVAVDGRTVLATAPLRVEVRSLREGAFDPTAFHDIRGEVAEPGGFPVGLAVALAGAALALVVTVALFRRRRPPAPLAPHEWALGEIDRIAAADLPARGETHRHFVEVSDVVRGFLERRFGLRAPERTTREFLEEAKARPEIGEDRRAALAAFLREADLVKFAGARPDPRRCEDALARARAFVVDAIATGEEATR